MFFLYCCALGGYIVAFIKLLTIYKLYHIWIHPFPLLPFISPSPESWHSFNRSHLAFTSIYTHFLHHIHSANLLSPPPPLSHDVNPLTWAGPGPPYCSLILQMRKKKTWHFLLVWDKDSYTGSFLVIFPCLYVLYSTTGLFPVIIYILP
jgi:hypothetical protein